MSHLVHQIRGAGGSARVGKQVRRNGHIRKSARIWPLPRPPVINTLPLGSKVAVCPVRGTFMFSVDTNESVDCATARPQKHKGMAKRIMNYSSACKTLDCAGLCRPGQSTMKLTGTPGIHAA